MKTVKKIKSPDITLTYYANKNDLVIDVLKQPRPLSLIAMNVEKLMKIRKNPKLLGIHPSIVYYSDGQPMTWFSKDAFPRLPGVEIWLELHKAAIENNLKVLIIGSQTKVIKRTEQKLTSLKLSDNVKFFDGYQAKEFYFEVIKTFKPDLVFIAKGSPRQEQFISELISIHTNAVYMGIGGSLDVFSGFKDRSPYLFRKFGMEFLYRLITEPSRILRQFVYVKFLALFIIGTFKTK